VTINEVDDLIVFL